MEIRICPKWLGESWFKSTVYKVKPQLWVCENRLKITIFKKGGVGMRSISKFISEKNKECCIEIPDILRAYVSQIETEDEIVLKLSKNNVMSVVVETLTYGIEYQIPNIVRTEDRHVDTSPKDCQLRICSRSWLNICRTMPKKGQITITCSKDKKMVSVKHSRGRWAAVIAAKNKANRNALFVCDSGVTKFCFATTTKNAIFSTLIFMDCGVLQWKSGNIVVHLAPYIDGK